MFARFQRWLARRRHLRIYDNPRSAKPRAVAMDWKRRRYWSAVWRGVLGNLVSVAVLAAAAVWWVR